MSQSTKDVEVRDAGFDASVVMPVHNGAHLIGEQLDALARQDFEGRFEVLVVLNRCTDDTGAVASRFGDRLHLRVIAADDVASAAYARNTGAALARSSALLFCDADDRVDRSWLREMLAALETADAVGGRLVNWDPSGGWAARVMPPGQATSLQTAAIGFPFIYSCSLAIRPETFAELGGFPDDGPAAAGDDVAFGAVLARAGLRMQFAERAVCYYRLRPTLRSAMRQYANYGRGQAWTIATYAPQLRRSTTRELVHLVRIVAGSAKPQPVDRLRRRMISIAFRQARLRHFRKLDRQASRVSTLARAS